MQHPVRTCLAFAAVALSVSSCSSTSPSTDPAQARAACTSLATSASELSATIEQSNATASSLIAGVRSTQSKLQELEASLPPAAAKDLKSAKKTLRTLAHEARTGNGGAFAQRDAKLQTSINAALAACHEQGL